MQIRELVSRAHASPDSQRVEVIINTAECQLNHNPLLLQFLDAPAIFGALREVKEALQARE